MPAETTGNIKKQFGSDVQKCLSWGYPRGWQGLCKLNSVLSKEAGTALPEAIVTLGLLVAGSPDFLKEEPEIWIFM